MNKASVLRPHSSLVPILVFTLAGCSEPEAPAVTEPVSRPVKVFEVGSSDGRNSDRYPAVIDAAERTDLSFTAGGVIEALLVTKAQQVEAGAVVARLDTRDFDSAVAAARSSFSTADEEYQRAVRLLKQDAIAKAVVDQRKNQREVAKAQLESAEKALEDAVLKAPFGGVVSSVKVEQSQTVAAGAVVASLIRLGSLEATISVPAAFVARVPTRSDQSATVILDAAPDQRIEASFTEADLDADTTSQTYSVTFSFEAPGDLIVLPGMNATVELNAAAGGTAQAPIVPLAAVQSDSSGEYVWRYQPEEGVVTRQAVELEQGIGETMVVTQGLTAGDQIVGAGGAFLSEGMRVTPWEG